LKWEILRDSIISDIISEILWKTPN
jgi:hypothetical protein